MEGEGNPGPQGDYASSLRFLRRCPRSVHSGPLRIVGGQLTAVPGEQSYVGAAIATGDVLDFGSLHQKPIICLIPICVQLFVVAGSVFEIVAVTHPSVRLVRVMVINVQITCGRQCLWTQKGSSAFALCGILAHQLFHLSVKLVVARV